MQHPGPILTRPTGCRLRVGWVGMGPEGRDAGESAATALSATASALAATTTTANRLGAVPPIPLLLQRRAPPASFSSAAVSLRRPSQRSTAPPGTEPSSAVTVVRSDACIGPVPQQAAALCRPRRCRSAPLRRAPTLPPELVHQQVTC